jgi:hypothetical protein
MNSKQRKIAGKMRARAELDAGAQLQAVEAARRDLAAEKLQRDGTILAERAEIGRQLKELNDQRHIFEYRMKRQAEDLDLLKGNPNLIREILLELELNEDPAVIALNLRKKFNLLIPEW